MTEINKPPNEKKYLKWLSSKVNPSKVSDFYFAYKEIEEYCLNIKIINNPLLETTDVETVFKVKETVERNKVFRGFHRKNINRLVTAIGYFYRYVKAEEEVFREEQEKIKERIISENTVVNRDQPETVLDKKSDIEKFERSKPASDIFAKKNMKVEENAIKENLYNRVNTYKKENSSTVYESENKFEELKDIPKRQYSASEKHKEENAGKVVDFENPSSYAYTKPTKYIYFEEPFSNFNSWKGMYVSLINVLLGYYNWIIEDLKGKSISSENGRVDIGNMYDQLNMISPKKLSNDMYIETNLSALDIVGKIKALLDICNVAYENLKIHYKKKEARVIDFNNRVQPERKEASIGNINRESNIDKSKAFYSWLKNGKGLSEATCRNYCYGINNINDFARERELFSGSIYDLDGYNEVYRTARILLQNYDFIRINESQHNRSTAALINYLQFIGDTSYSVAEGNRKVNSEESANEKLKNYYKILIEHYPRGFRYNSPIHMKKFRAYWEKPYGEELDKSDEEIYDNINRITIPYQKEKQTFALIPETLLSEKSKKELFSYINESFSKGKQAIYYKALYERVQAVLCESGINNPDMLKTYLSHVNEGQYYVERSYLTQERGIKIDPLDEVRNYLIQLGMPIKTDELCDELTHIPRKKIELTLHTNKEFKRNAKSEYFYPDVVKITEDELSGISDIINQEIEENYFMSENELTDAVKKKYPQVFERQTQFTKLGMRGAIGYKLKDRYSFKGKIISEKGENLSMSDVYARFCRKRYSFSLKDLKTLKKELNSQVIYFDVVYDNVLRISKDEFVSKNCANFDIKKTDEAIDKFCEGDYISIKDIEYFGSFPDAVFSWNSYLLEHYVAEYSKKYKLLHTNFNESSCVGAIVKNTAYIEDFYALVVDVIANSNIILDSDTALDHLCKRGFLGRRSYRDIDKVLVQAKAIREKRG